MGWFKKHKILTVILALVVLGGIVSAASGGGNKTSSPATSSGQPAAQQEPAKEEKKFDYNAFFEQVKNDMTKAEVTALAAKEPESCTESQDPTFGTIELCSYGNAFIDKGAVSITFSQGKVSNKTKTSF